MGKDKRDLENLEKQSFQSDRNTANYSQKIPTEQIALKKTKRVYDWMEKSGVKELTSRFLRQYLMMMGYRVPDYVADPNLSFGTSRNLYTEHKRNGNGDWIFTGTSMDIDDANHVRVNPEIWRADDAYVLGTAGNELGHACAREYTGTSAGSHDKLGLEPYFQAALALAIIKITRNKELARKAYSATQYTRR